MLPRAQSDRVSDKPSPVQFWLITSRTLSSGVSLCLRVFSQVVFHAEHTGAIPSLRFQPECIWAADQTSVAFALPGVCPAQWKAVTLKRAGTSLWGGIKPQPSVDTSHSGSFKIASVPVSIKLQMTAGADHMWALSSKLSHSVDEE